MLRALALAPVLLAAVAPTAAADASGEAPAAQVQTRHERFRYVGAGLDIGAPDLAGVSIFVRPVRWVRLHAGVNTDVVGVGIRGGATLIPFGGAVSPSLTIEGGHVFEGNANLITSEFGFQSAALQSLGYSYASGHVGLEFGKQNRAVFFIHGGVSYLETTLHNLSSDTVKVQDPTVRVVGPSGKIGFIIFI